ncbi:MAG: hypothetical protein HPY57_14835 [Ignavibacteria bacterium]|nr:hypothetical protein [Ignavibacteria bacterium]
MLEYRLDKLTDDKLGRNIYRKRHKLYTSIVKFSKQVKNDGIFAENIVRLVFDAINLNHFHKNHPHVDIGVIIPIPGITKRNEILSVKSTINYKNTSSLLTDTKAIKIESLFSYLLFAHYNFDVEYVETVNSPVTLLNKAIKEANNYKKYVDYKKVVQVTTFYLMFHNEKGIEDEFLSDIKNIIEDKENDLSYGKYSEYDEKVKNSLLNLDAPISIGLCYIDKNADDKEGIVCVIKKTNPIQLNKYWDKLLDIWCTREYFGATNKQGGKVTKYLRYSDICDIYGIEQGDDFPIEIRIKTGSFGKESIDGETKEIKHKEKTDKRIRRMYVATKFKDADFQDKDYRIVSTFNKMIDVLEDEPNLVTKFDNFIKEISRKEFKKLPWLTKK